VNAGAKIVYEDGFKISGADNYGKCMAQAQTAYLADLGDPVLSFEENLIVGCSVSYTLDQLKQACVKGNNLMGGFELFKNMEEFQYFGQFGDADLYKEKVSSTKCLILTRTGSK